MYFRHAFGSNSQAADCIPPVEDYVGHGVDCVRPAVDCIHLLRILVHLHWKVILRASALLHPVGDCIPRAEDCIPRVLVDKNATSSTSTATSVDVSVQSDNLTNTPSFCHLEGKH